MSEEVAKIQLAVPFRGQNSYEAWLRGVRDLAGLLEWNVDAVAWGGSFGGAGEGIPEFLTLTRKDIYDQEAEKADTGQNGEEESDSTAVADSEGSPSDSEPVSST